MHKLPCNTVILRLLTQDCSMKFSHKMAPGVIESVYWGFSWQLSPDLKLGNYHGFHDGEKPANPA